MLSMSLSGLLCDRFGWESIFYVFGKYDYAKFVALYLGMAYKMTFNVLRYSIPETSIGKQVH